MAGGFDGMEVTHATKHAASIQTAQASVMEVKYEESTQGVDNLYKYLIIKELWIS